MSPCDPGAGQASCSRGTMWVGGVSAQQDPPPFAQGTKPTAVPWRTGLPQNAHHIRNHNLAPLLRGETSRPGGRRPMAQLTIMGE